MTSQPTMATAREIRSQTTARLLEAHAAATDPAERASIEDDLVRTNMEMATAVARRFYGRGVASEDLQSVAYLGLVKAVRGFDVDRGHDFMTYAVPTIRGEIRRHFRDHGWTVRPPRAIQETQTKVFGCQGDLYQELGRAPRPSEIAEHLGLDVDLVVEALAAQGCFEPTSLDMPSGPSSDVSLGATLPSTRESGFDVAEARAVLEPVLAGLSKRDRLIVEMRFLRGMTQSEIGERIGVTQMQVSRLLKGILGRLREQLSDDPAASDALSAQMTA